MQTRWTVHLENHGVRRLAQRPEGVDGARWERAMPEVPQSQEDVELRVSSWEKNVHTDPRDINRAGGAAARGPGDDIPKLRVPHEVEKLGKIINKHVDDNHVLSLDLQEKGPLW